MNNKFESKLCVVCGDKAIGFNFDVLTCESCKCFFRRNAFKDLKCKFDTNECVIQINTRKCCPKCRIQKCLAMGMKKDHILNKEARSKRVQLIEQNRQKRRLKTDGSPYNTIITRNNKQQSNIVSSSILSSSPLYRHLFTQLHDCPMSSSTNESISSFNELTNKMFEENIDVYNDIDRNGVSKSSTYKRALKMGISIIPVTRHIADYSRTFNELEGYRFRELMSAAKQLEIIAATNICEIVSMEEFFAAIDTLKINDIQNVTKVCKSITGFIDIPSEDQIVLLKYGSLEIHTMRSICYYNHDSQYWTINLNNNNAMILHMDFVKFAETHLHNDFRDYINNLFMEIDQDYIILDIMTAIVLFNPYRPGLQNKMIIRLQQHVYLYLLKRYLMIKYLDKQYADEKFNRLLNSMIDLYYVETRCRQNTLNRMDLPPLLKEVLEE
ncbi:nuclear hormone receptor HR96-like [Oppia nitens]|uniref:nuclear hormone receptor HR96-like n=1 Tax=Oppia nitens TaxID=1686743 RepID=UPI0023DCC31E|nr:nuclear hormone receptor HR96-like [Oppia nitens]